MKRDLRYGGSVTGKTEYKAIMRSVAKSIKNGNWQAGKEAALMEKEAAKQLGVKHCVLTTSGSAAGLLALSALELPKGSEVIIPAVTFPTIFNIILQCGLTPVVVDVDDTYTIDVDLFEKAITPKTRAVIPVHAVGVPADMTRIMKIARKHKLYVIEDNCDGWGGTIHGRKVGGFGQVSFTSFHAAHIVTTGVGGGVFTNDADIAKKVRMYRDWGRQADTNEPNKYKNIPKDYNPRFIYEKIGYNFQILELQAAMGRVQLKKANKIKAARRKNADYLMKGLEHLPLFLPRLVDGADPCWFSFPITVQNNERGALVPYLEKHGIETRSMFAGNITKHPAYKHSKYRVGSTLETSNFIMANSFWITVHPRLKKSDLDYIITVFNSFYGKTA